MTNNKEKTSMGENQQEDKKTLNPFTLLFSFTIIVAILTYILPSGQYEREEVDGRTVLVNDSFEFTDRTFLGFFDIFTSFHEGLMNGAAIVFTIFIFGGAIGIMKKTGALDSFIRKIVVIFKDSAIFIIPVLVLYFGLLGALIGTAESSIVYLPLIIPVMIALRYDAITAVGVVFLGALAVGFTSAILNPYTVGVAQEIAELPYMSGWEFRIAIFITFYVIVVTYLMIYARRVKKNPKIGDFGNYSPDESPEIDWEFKMSTTHVVALSVFVIAILSLVTGVALFSWGLQQIGAVILFAGVAMGIVCRLHPNEIGDGFVKGVQDIATGALVVGFALAIVEVMQRGDLLDVMLYYSANLLDGLPVELAAVGMFITQLFINLLVPSGSGQAALTMPIMIPLSDLLGVTRQTAVVAFQLGDGLSNIIIPTFGVLLASLSMAGVSYVRWVKWLLPLFLILVVVGAGFVVFAQMIELGPF